MILYTILEINSMYRSVRRPWLLDAGVQREHAHIQSCYWYRSGANQTYPKLYHFARRYYNRSEYCFFFIMVNGAGE